MKRYRVYFRDGANAICGREDFEAVDAAMALCMAEILFDACSDLAAHFDLWCGTEVILNSRPSTETLLDVMEKRQANIAEIEERIRDSDWRIASSERLLQRLEGLHGKTAGLGRATL